MKWITISLTVGLPDSSAAMLSHVTGFAARASGVLIYNATESGITNSLLKTRKTGWILVSREGRR